MRALHQVIARTPLHLKTCRGGRSNLCAEAWTEGVRSEIATPLTHLKTCQGVAMTNERFRID